MPKKKRAKMSFEETSRKLGCDESPEAFASAFASVVRPAKVKLEKHTRQKPKQGKAG